MVEMCSDLMNVREDTSEVTGWSKAKSWLLIFTN